jgi:LPXTG-site transpeptidase (sortase) family protein
MRALVASVGTMMVLAGLGLAGLYAAVWVSVELIQPNWQPSARPAFSAAAPAAAAALVAPGGESAAFFDAELAAAEATAAAERLEATLAAEVAKAAQIPGPPPPASPAEWLEIPRIGVDSKVEQVFLKGREWPVPKFVVGHMGETANPGDVGNAVFAGHLLSIASGNVFAHLEKLEIGDEMTFTSADGERAFRVVESKLVSNKDVSVLASREGKATVTLITCAGRWVQREMDYDQRRIVVAEAVKAGGGVS